MGLIHFERGPLWELSEPLPLLLQRFFLTFIFILPMASAAKPLKGRKRFNADLRELSTGCDFDSGIWSIQRKFTISATFDLHLLTTMFLFRG